MKITKSQLKQIIKEEMNKTISAGQPQQGELLFERNVPSFRQFLGYLGLQMAITAPALGLVASQIPDSSPEDSTEEVLKDRAAERLVDMGPEKAKEVINKFGPENEEIKDVFTRYNDKVRAEGGYTDEPDPASSWNENRMKLTKSQLKQIIKEELLKEFGNVNNFGGKAGALGAAAGRAEPVYEDDPDSEIQRKAFEYFSNLQFTTDVIKYMVTNIAPPDLEVLMRKIPKIDTAEQEPPEG